VSESSDHSADVRGLGAVVLAGATPCLPGDAAQVPWRGEPPVRAAARAAVEAGLWPVVVVIARDGDETRAAVAGLPVATVLDEVERPDASTGIRRGLARLRECAPRLRGAVILDCTPPGADAARLEALAADFAAGGRPIAACGEPGGPGLPALFAAEVLPELLSLAHGQGATDLLLRDPARVTRSPPAPRG
jgi:molybdenum cofactor cytidylyltransferase